MTPVTTASMCLIPFLATFSSGFGCFLKKNILVSDLDGFGNKGKFWYFNHDDIVLYCGFDLIKSKVLGKYHRAREGPVKTLFHQHALGIKVDRELGSIS
jgi:hypothetical protein